LLGLLFFIPAFLKELPLVFLHFCHTASMVLVVEAFEGLVALYACEGPGVAAFA